jgi:hypothetical protein
MAIDHPGNWSYIAGQLDNSRSRSPVMVTGLGLPLLQKLRKVGLESESEREIELVPGPVFGPGRLTGFQREETVAQFNKGKARHATAATAAAAQERASFGDDSES